MSRDRYWIAFDWASGRWQLKTTEGEGSLMGPQQVVLSSHDTKEEAEGYGRDLCNELLRGGVETQLVVHLQNGDIEYEHTYPDRTPNRKG